MEELTKPFKIVGITGRGIITSSLKIKTKQSETSPDSGSSQTITLSCIEFIKPEPQSKSKKESYFLKSIEINKKYSESNRFPHEITHASIQILNKYVQWDVENVSKKSKNKLYYLLGIVKKYSNSNESDFRYSSSLYLVQEEKGNSIKVELEILEEIKILDNLPNELKIHILSTKKNPSEESDTDTTEDSNHLPIRFRNQILILNLEENITVYNVETIPQSQSAKIELLSSECVAKSFWWAQWNFQHEFLAFAHTRKQRQSSFDDEEDSLAKKSKPLLSVLQFHEKFPREYVLNMPLDMDPKSESSIKPISILIPDPNILSSTSIQLKLFAHPSGAVYLFRIHESIYDPNKSFFSGQPEIQELHYSVNLFHHNKTLSVKVKLKEEEKSAIPIKIDAAIYSTDQYLLVVGWPIFIHILDVGTTHEPSHHLIFDCKSLFLNPIPSAPFLCLSSISCIQPDSKLCDEKNDYSTKTNISLVFQDLSHHVFELNSSVLLPLLDKADLKFKLGFVHYLLIHMNDINVAKRVTYDEGKKSGNLHLKQIYQEFLIGHSYLQTKKQILPNMESFISLIPYSCNPDLNSSDIFKGLLMDLSNNSTDVTSMLLSPSQRVFPHNITDIWVSLWQVNRQFTRSKRFSHKNVAEKLLLSLQCYKPEALSRANTPGPMSPSSPMICTSVGDIAGLFGRRTTELQLPFVEHEFCTANKQEYIFSINLRELSMHLLKERKEWPLHGHTVAGKYVCALVETARLLCHLVCLTVHLQPTKARDKGFKLVDSLEWKIKLQLFMLMEHYALALGTLACPLPQGFTPFFAYLGYRVLQFDQFLWHVRTGTFELQIDLVKTIMADLSDTEEENVAKKLHLLSLLPKSRANRVLNGWLHPMSISLRARQHTSDLLSGVVSQARKSTFSTKRKKSEVSTSKDKLNPLDTFFQLLTAKANAAEIDLGLLTEATMISMDMERVEINKDNGIKGLTYRI